MGHNSAELIHIFTEAKKLAYEDRAKYYADPNFNSVPVNEADFKNLCQTTKQIN